jgi:hypothetical protein
MHILYGLYFVRLTNLFNYVKIKPKPQQYLINHNVKNVKRLIRGLNCLK